ncbi:MAG TPA: hypothetical protein EYQ18_09175 [Candidatus Handelsmanbacteria bacterium]|nr:hypothetical protein [Candidatus Handelsmanbacteria bacterium]
MHVNEHLLLPNGWADDRNPPERWQMPYAASEAFHRYGIWRCAETTVVFNHDGEQVAEVKTGGAFDEAMYLFFATEVFLGKGCPPLNCCGTRRAIPCAPTGCAPGGCRRH